jgi:DNA-binding MarR family transcriptional regulator
MSGSATFTMVMSSSSMKTPVHTATSVHHFPSVAVVVWSDMGSPWIVICLTITQCTITDTPGVKPEYRRSPTVPTSEPMLPALARLPGHVVWRAVAKVQAAVAETLQVEVDHKGYAALLALADGEPRSQQTLADTIGVSRTTMTGVATRLVEQGLVERVRNPADRRSYALTRTAAGAEAARAWESPTEDLEVALTAGLPTQDADDLRALLLAVAEPELAEDTPEQLRTSVAFLITRVHFRMSRDFQAALEPLGIEPPHFGVLAALGVTGPVSQADTARTIGVSSPRVVTLADDLEERGLVERRRAPQDRRTQLLHLSPAAEDVLAKAKVLAGEAAGARLAPLSADDARRLVTLLVRFVDA